MDVEDRVAYINLIIVPFLSLFYFFSDSILLPVKVGKLAVDADVKLMIEESEWKVRFIKEEAIIVELYGKRLISMVLFCKRRNLFFLSRLDLGLK